MEIDQKERNRQGRQTKDQTDERDGASEADHSGTDTDVSNGTRDAQEETTFTLLLDHATPRHGDRNWLDEERRGFIEGRELIQDGSDVMELNEHRVININQIKNIQFFECERAGKTKWRASMGSRGEHTGWRNRKAEQTHIEPVDQVKQSVDQWDDKPIGWDV